MEAVVVAGGPGRTQARRAGPQRATCPRRRARQSRSCAWHRTAHRQAGRIHRLQPGDVLITHATTPIWTPLFNIAAAAVTEVGGPFSHAAIVAREFGIPLVNGAVDATREIADGTSIVVDGSAGIVELPSAATASR